MYRHNGVTISPADGGFIITWTEAAEPEEPKGFDAGDSLEHRLMGPIKSPFTPHEAVRTTIEEALKLVGKVLKEKKLAQGDEAAYMAPA